MFKLWFERGISLNVKKTKYSTIIATQCKITHLDPQPDVRINGHPVDRVRTHRYLGVEIDDTLTWHSQINQIVKKLSAGLAILKRVRALVPRDTLIDQFRYIKIQSQTIDLRTRLWGINPTNSVFIPQSLVMRSIV